MFTQRECLLVDNRDGRHCGNAALVILPDHPDVTALAPP